MKIGNERKKTGKWTRERSAMITLIMKKWKNVLIKNDAFLPDTSISILSSSREFNNDEFDEILLLHLWDKII